MRRVLLLVSLLLPLQMSSQTYDEIGAMMKIAGVSDPEEMDSEEVEHLSHYLHNPMHINGSSISDLQDCGLFSAYQAASLVDYRSRHGDIRSFMELAAIDGFGTGFVEAIWSFVSLDVPDGTKWETRGGHVRHDLAARAGGRSGEEYMYGVKYRVDAGKFRVSVSGSRSYSSKEPYLSYLSGNVSWMHRFGRVVAGDFNARFGQGLCLWNTAVIGGLTSPSAFMKKPSGVSPTYSFTGSSALTGVAGEISVGKWKGSLMLAMPGIKNTRSKPDKVSVMPVFNLMRTGRYGHVSLTHLMSFSDCFSADYRIPQMKTSVDASVCIRGVNLFGESAYDWVNGVLAAVCGTDMMVSEKVRVAALVRYCPAKGFSNEHGLAASAEMNLKKLSGNISADVCHYPESKAADDPRSIQMKVQSNLDYRPNDILELKFRVSERFRTWGQKFRTDCRAESLITLPPLHGALRLNVLKCVSLGYLGYLEVGYRKGSVTSYLRAGIFVVDDWNDRIYVYERDAPGSFNVPALYGRGYWLAFNASWHPVRWCRLYMRMAWTDYPFMSNEKRKPGRAELKFHAVFRL